MPRAEALFCSQVQPSEKPDGTRVAKSIAAMIRVHGSHGCACQVAAAFGDHPDIALERMRWARDTVAVTYPKRRLP
jgi:hypothetical protein